MAIASIVRTESDEAAPTHQIAYQWVNLGEMFRPPELQREIRDSHVKYIIDHFSDVAFGTPTVSYREPGNRGPRGEAYAEAVGQHRLQAAREMGRTSVYCQVVFGLTKAEEAQLYSDEDKRRKQDPLYMFHVSRLAGNAEANALWDLATRAGYSIPRSISATPHRGDLFCIAAVMTAYRAGTLAQVLETITAAFDRDPKGCRHHFVAGLSTLWRFRSNAADKARLASKLAALGAPAIMSRYHGSQQAQPGGVSIVMANTMIGVYNANIKSDDRRLEYIQMGEIVAARGKASGIARSGKGKTLAEARAEVAARAAVNA